jgi:hypothetical protein
MEIPLNECKPMRANTFVQCTFCLKYIERAKPMIGYGLMNICPACMKEAKVTLGGQYAILNFKDRK